MKRFAFRKPALTPGLEVGSYRLTRRCGEGDHGSVWEAIGPNNEKVALKAFDRLDSSTRGKVRQELRVLSDGRHEHLVKVFDAREAHGRFWAAMNFVEGEHLRQRVGDHGPVSDQYEFALTMVQIACALARVHDVEAGTAKHAGAYVHCDVKPQNVMVSGWGSRVHATLVDLSLCAPAADGAESGSTLPFAAPELGRGDPPSDRADVYSLAATGHYLLTAQYVDAGRSKPSEAGSANWAADYDDLLLEALDPMPERRPDALELARRMLAIAWPAGAPFVIARIPIELEPATIEARRLAPVDLADPWRPRKGLLEMVSEGADGDVELTRRAALIMRAKGTDAARPAYSEAAESGSAVAIAWLAQDRELELGPEAALPLWNAASAAGSAVAARRTGQIAADGGDPAAAVGAFRRAAERRDADGAFELFRLLDGKPELACDEGEAERALILAVELHHADACLEAGRRAEKRGEIPTCERFYEQASASGIAEAALLLADLRGRRGERERAEEAYRRASSLGDKTAPLTHAAYLGRIDEEEAQREVLRAAQHARVPGAALALARLLAMRNPKAAEVLATSEPAEPGDLAAAAILATLALRADRPEEVIELLEPLRETGTQRLLLATAYLAEGQVANAEATVQSAGAQSANDWVLEASEPVLERFADLPAVDGLAPAAQHLGELARCRAGSPRAGDAEAEAVKDSFARGRALGCRACAAWVAFYARGSDEEAEELERASAMGSDWATVKLANLRHGRGERAEAERICRSAVAAGIEETVGTPGPRHLLAMNYAAGDAEKEKLLREADAGGSLDAPYYLAEIVSARSGSRDPEVEHIYGRGDLRGSAGSADRLGSLLAAVRGDFEAALQAHRRAVDRGKDPIHMYNLGVAHNALSNSREAEKWWRDAAAKGSVAAQAVLAERQFKQPGDHSETVEALRSAMEDADSVVELYVLGEAFKAAAEIDDAVECLRRSHARGFAWASLKYSEFLDDVNAGPVLEEALARATDDRDRHWTSLSERERLCRHIEDRLSTLPKVHSR